MGWLLNRFVKGEGPKNPEVLPEIKPGHPWLQDRDANQFGSEEPWRDTSVSRLYSISSFEGVINLQGYNLSKYKDF